MTLTPFRAKVGRPGEKIPFVTFVPFVVNFLFSSVSFLVAA
jgi:hypothetical protein